MVGQNVNDYSFQRKNQAVTLGSKTTFVIDGDPQLLFQRLSVIATREEQEDPAALFNNNRAFIRRTVSGYPFKGANFLYFLMIGKQSYVFEL